MWYVYLLSSKNTGKWYIGSTRDLRKRILSHNLGKNKAIKHGAPWRIIYCEMNTNKQDARAREDILSLV